MKKDIYPDIRIEVISEGLTKKILGKTKDAAPVVYGEEQPEGKNLPNVGIKGKNKELQSLLETSNKKPTYTGLVKEAIFELRKQPEGQYGQFQPGGRTKTPLEGGTASIGNPEAAAKREEAKQAQAQLAYERNLQEPMANIGSAMAAARDYKSSLQSGTDSGYGSGIGPGYRPSEFRLPAGQPPTPVSEIEEKPVIPGKAPSGTTGAGLTDYKPMAGTSDTVVLDPREQGATAPDRTKIDEMAENITDNVGGTEGGPTEPPSGPSTPDVDPKITSEIDLGVRANPEVTRPKNSKGDLLPQFGSSGYFDAILQIGEGGENVEANYGVSNLGDFLSLYAQNPQFDKNKFLDNLGIEQPEAPEQKANIEKANPFKASLKKQAPPMAMTMNRPPNMGVGIQQPVVTGAGTMKNIEKDVAANKPAAVKATTKARRRKPKTIEMMVKSITDRLMKQQESDVDTFSNKRQNFGDLTTGQMDRDTGTRPGTAFTRMTDSGTDEYGSPDQFIVTPPKDADAAVQSAASKRKDIESQVASQTANIPSASGGTPQGAPPPASTRQQASQTPKRFLKPPSK